MYMYMYRKCRGGSAHLATTKFTIPSGFGKFGSSGVREFELGSGSSGGSGFWSFGSWEVREFGVVFQYPSYTHHASAAESYSSGHASPAKYMYDIFCLKEL